MEDLDKNEYMEKHNRDDQGTSEKTLSQTVIPRRRSPN